MIYEFELDDLVRKFKSVPDTLKGIKLVAELEIDGESAQVQIILTVDKNDFVKPGEHYLGLEN
jgi:hypothetical protein